LSDTPKLGQEKADYIRDAMAWLILIFTVTILCFLKPPVVLLGSAMYLPQDAKYSEVSKDNIKSVKVIAKNDNSSNNFSDEKIGFVTVMLPYVETNQKEAPYDGIERARGIVAQAGASKLLIERIYVMPWFDTGMSAIRIEAIALK